MLFYYLLHAQDRISVEDLAQAALERGDRVKSIAEQLLEEGQEIGLEKGMEKGKQEGLFEAAVRFLRAGMTAKEVSRVLGISEEKILALYDQKPKTT